MLLKRKPALAAAFLAAGAIAPVFSAYAATTLYGGGATLPAIAYVGTSWFAGNNRLSSAANGDAPDADSLFGHYAAGFGHDAVSYCQTGSGAGKKVLDGALLASGTCPTFTGTPAGFDAPTTDPNFAASDAPMSLSEYQLTLTNKGSTHTEPMQIPALAGAVAVIYNNTAAATQLALTDAQVCGIFTGHITNWSQLGLAAQPITVVYRSDGSGTTFSFTNHLSAVCAPAGSIVTSQNFTGSSQSASSPVGLFPLPSNFVGASGNPGVVTAISNTPGAIGYGEVADALLHNPALTYATVNGFDPLKNLKAPAITTLKDEVITGADLSTGRPTVATLASEGVTVAKAGCLVAADPNSYDNISGSYPIVGVTNLLGYETGNGANTTQIRNLLKSPFGFHSGKVKTIGTGTGFAYLTASQSTVVGNCINK